MNCPDVPLLYVLDDKDFNVDVDAYAMLVKVMKLRNDG